MTRVVSFMPNMAAIDVMRLKLVDSFSMILPYVVQCMPRNLEKSSLDSFRFSRSLSSIFVLSLMADMISKHLA